MTRRASRWVASALLTLVVSLSATSALGQPALDGARAALERAEVARVAAERAFEAQRGAHAAAAARVDEARGQITFGFEVGALRDALREQQAEATVLAERDAALRSANARVESARRELVEALRGEVRRLDTDLETAPDRVERARRIAALNDEIASLSAAAADTPVAIERIAEAEEDSPDELFDAAAELLDHERRLERRLDEVREALRDAQARNRAIAAAGEFAAEESLLDDGGGRRASRRASDRGTEASGGASADDDPDVVVGTPNDQSDGAAGGGTGGDGFSGPDRSDGEFGAPAAPGAGAEDDDLGVGSPEPPPTFGASDALTDTPSARTVPVAQRAEDAPDWAMEEPSGRRGRRESVSTLRARAEAVEAEIEAVRARRLELMERAEALDR